ncbi:MAG TPA: hypothetical protein VGK94_07970 [Candidatus Polarisedimenticolia bacterium]|jgi:hypothetical protein
MTPQDGPAEVVDLTTVFVSGGRTYKVLTDIDLVYEPETEARDTINRRSRPLLLGYRPVITMVFQLNIMSFYAQIAQLASRLMDPYWVVELALDNGATYRQIVLRRAPSPEPFGNKTVAGASFKMTVACRDLIAELSPIATGTAW